MTDAQLERELERVRQWIVELAAMLAMARGKHDAIVLRLADNAGLSDKRPAAVR